MLIRGSNPVLVPLSCIFSLLKHRKVTVMAIGVVKWFNETKGFGFIKPENGGADVFVHVRDVQESKIQTLRENDRVSYEMKQGRNGRESACNLALI